MVWRPYGPRFTPVINTHYTCSFYRPETGPEYIELLRKPLELLFRRHSNTLPFVTIAGNFNYPFIDWLSLSSNDTSYSHFLDTVNDFHLHQFVAAPTRFGTSTSSLLDLVFSSLPSGIVNVTVGREFSDHCLVYFNITSPLVTSEEPPRKIWQG